MCAFEEDDGNADDVGGGDVTANDGGPFHITSDDRRYTCARWFTSDPILGVRWYIPSIYTAFVEQLTDVPDAWQMIMLSMAASSASGRIYEQ